MSETQQIQMAVSKHGDRYITSYEPQLGDGVEIALRVVSPTPEGGVARLLALVRRMEPEFFEPCKEAGHWGEES